MSTLPEKVRCTAGCRREFPLNARYPGIDIAMLVVPEEVTSVEAALKAAKCQKCLCLNGPMDRGLMQVIDQLQASTKDVSVSMAASEETVEEDEGIDADALQALSSMGQSAGRPVLVDVRELEGTHRGRPVQDDPDRMSRRDVRAALRAQPKEPKGPSLPEEALEALAQAGESARVRDEAAKRSKLASFGGLMGSLGRRLEQIRRAAPIQRVDEMIDDFWGKLAEALPKDPKQRSKKKLLAHLGTNQQELRELESLCYHHCSVAPSDGDNGLWGVQGAPGSHLEPREGDPLYNQMRGKPTMRMDPFPGGERPAHWSGRGEGRRPTLGLVSVVGGSSFPDPNPPREAYVGPKIVYAADKTFIRFGDDTQAYDQPVKDHGTLRLCAQGMYAMMERTPEGWVYHPCLPGEQGAGPQTLMFVRLALRRVDGQLVTAQKQEELQAEREAEQKELEAEARERAKWLIPCIEVSDQGERALPHEIQIAIGLHIGEYDDLPRARPVYAHPEMNEIEGSASTEDESIGLSPQTIDGEQPTA